MGGGRFGFRESVAIALGGMIGGGIYAVLGVVVKVTGALAWLAFVFAGVVAACAGYSYVKLNALSDGQGGSPTYIDEFADDPTLAGMAGWTLLFGYVGSMAMYAFAFGSYFADLAGVHQAFGFPVRPVVSALVVVGFVGLNAAGARETGIAEVILVALKVAILVGFVGLGLWTAFGRTRLRLGVSKLGFGPVMAAAVSFVAFQGWQLLMYDQDAIQDAQATIKRAISVSIPTAVVIYVGVALVTTSLVNVNFVAQHPETALAVAARTFGGRIGYLVISLSALFSTASAVNATLFSSAKFSKGLVADGLLPDRFASQSGEGMPTCILVVLGALTTVLTVYGSLEGITSFASLAFIVVFGGMSYLAFRQRSEESVSAAWPAIGVAGTAVFLPLLLWHLYAAERHVFYTVALISAAVLAIELLYFERKSILEGVRTVEKRI